MKTFTRLEIIQHNTKEDCWIIIRNNVYDITGFIASHPGGGDILLARAGEDATSYFITKHGNNKSTLKHLEQLKIGELPQTERITVNDLDEPFLMELIDRCYSDKLYTAPVWYKNQMFWIRFIGVLMFFSLSYFVLYGHMTWYCAIGAVIIQALISTSLFGLIAHEHTHRNFPKQKVLRFLLQISWPAFWPFISQTPLRYEHNSHHIKIGDPEFDYEVAAFAPLMRFSSHVKHTSIHRYQHILAKYLYPFYANIITTWGGIYSGFWKKHNKSVAIEHSLSILASLSYFIVIPSIINGSVTWYVALYLIYQCCLFYGIYAGAAINHFVPSVVSEIPIAHQNKYGYYICQNTTNFGISNPLWFWYTGGFNLQIEHHLIPFIPIENLRKMVPIVQELSKKHGYPYHSYSAFIEMWRDHYSYLFTLSQVDLKKPSDTESTNKASYQAR